MIHDRSCHVFVHPFIPQPDHLLSLLASLDSHFPSSSSSLHYYFTTTTLPKAKEFTLKDLFLLLQPSHAAAPPPLTEAAAALLCRKSPEKAICTHTHTQHPLLFSLLSLPLLRKWHGGNVMARRWKSLLHSFKLFQVYLREGLPSLSSEVCFLLNLGSIIKLLCHPITPSLLYT